MASSILSRIYLVLCSDDEAIDPTSIEAGDFNAGINAENHNFTPTSNS
jgi:hypothetical protein